MQKFGLATASSKEADDIHRLSTAGQALAAFSNTPLFKRTRRV